MPESHQFLFHLSETSSSTLSRDIILANALLPVALGGKPYMTAARTGARLEEQTIAIVGENGDPYEKEPHPDGWTFTLNQASTVTAAARRTTLDSAAGDHAAAAVPAPPHHPVLLIERMTVRGSFIQKQLSELIGGPASEPIRFEKDARPDAQTTCLLLSLGALMIYGHAGTTPLSTSSVAAAKLRETIACVIIHGVSHNYSDRLRSVPLQHALPRHIIRAVKFMNANISRPLRLKEIAHAVGVHPRSLQLAFRSFCHCTPLEYLRDLRLQGIRKDLLDPERPNSVGAIAYAWGFASVSLLSRHYRKAFGETPSLTLARRGTAVDPLGTAGL